MSVDKHQTTGDPLTRVTRSFDIAVSQFQALDQGIEKIMAAPGVIHADANPGRTKLRVSYDVRNTNAEKIQRSIEAAGLAAPGSLWRRIRVAWLGSLDANCRDNAAHQPACCSKPPPGLGAKQGHRH